MELDTTLGGRLDPAISNDTDGSVVDGGAPPSVTSYIDALGNVIDVQKGRVEVSLAYLKTYEDIGTAEV